MAATAPSGLTPQGERRAVASRAARALLHGAASLIESFPDPFFSRFVQMALDALLCLASLFLAYDLRFDSRIPAEHLLVMLAWMCVLPVVRPLVMLALGGYRSIWRYFSLHDSLVLGLSAFPPTAVMLMLRFALPMRSWMTRVPASVILMEYLLFLLLAGGMRAFRRATFETLRSAGVLGRRRALLIGNEMTLPGALRHVSAQREIQLIGLLAPEAKLHGLHMGGFRVLEEPSALGEMLAAHAVDLVLIADASMDCIAETVATATEFGVDVSLLPSADDIVRGDVRVSANPRPELAFSEKAVAGNPDPKVVEAFLDRVVLVTGGGGSIGAELVRQVSKLPVRTLVVLDRDENSIFEMQHELAAGGTSVRVAPVVGDIRDRGHMERLFAEHRPHYVLHAAAYKHVPIMEANCAEAVLNNVMGTRVLLDLAIEHGAEHFLMISTDKAVNPTSVMGASKRVAELLVQSRAQAATRCACVRFGNVVGSRGSVVPIFLRQIANGGPVTITDEKMTRYFMTIPEAVQLVLQAATLGSRGDIYMLEMGDPVKITNLARKLIEMSGLKPDIDIKIEFVGARAGEKMTEQLWQEDAAVTKTEFPRVNVVAAERVSDGLGAAVAALEEAAMERDDSCVLERLRTMPIGFRERAAAAVR